MAGSKRRNAEGADTIASTRGPGATVEWALDEGHLSSPFSLAEVRVLYEIAHRDLPNATDIGRDQRLDAGYLSRLLRTLEERGLVSRTPSPNDGRQSLLSLTAEGHATVSDLEARASADVATLLAARSGEYQRDITFEALVARIAADFIDHFDAAREYCWIAERDGVNVGCVFLVKHPERDGVDKLRMLLVEPTARGLGIGKRLVEECTQFARRSGYHTISLWTNDILIGARQIYQHLGYTLVSEERHHSFGHDLVGQYWELAL